MKQTDLFGGATNIGSTGDPTNPNPLVRLHGEMGGEKCKNCKHLIWHQASKRYYKCNQRKITRGAATDHRVNWDACKLFIRKT